MSTSSNSYAPTTKHTTSRGFGKQVLGVPLRSICSVLNVAEEPRDLFQCLQRCCLSRTCILCYSKASWVVGNFGRRAGTPSHVEDNNPCPEASAMGWPRDPQKSLEECFIWCETCQKRLAVESASRAVSQRSGTLP